MQSPSIVAVKYLLGFCHQTPLLTHLAVLAFLRQLGASVRMNPTASGPLDVGEFFPEILAALRAYDERELLNIFPQSSNVLF